MPRTKSGVSKKESTWNLNKPGGWEIYKKKTKDVAQKLEEIVSNEEDTVKQIMNKVEKIENKVKFAK